LLKKELKDYKMYIEKMNALPIFANMAKHLDYKRIGLQILNNEEVVKEFTSHNKNGKIIKVEDGLKNPELTIKIEEKTVKQMTSQKEQAWIEKHPLEAAMKYSGKVEMPFLVKLKLLKLLSKRDEA